MTVTISLLHRNILLYWSNVKYRYVSLLTVYLIIIGIKGFNHLSFTDIFMGLNQIKGRYDLPFIWLILSFIPIMITGNAFYELVRKQYIFASKISLTKYLWSLASVSLILYLVFPITTYLVLLGNIGNFPFFLLYFTLSYLVALLYGFTSIFIDPIITQLIFFAIFIMTTMFNNFPITSQLMAIRRDNILTSGNFITLFGIIILIFIANAKLKQIDFTV